MLEQLLKYQEVDGELKAIEDSLKNSEEFKKYASARKFLLSVDDNRGMFEERSAALISNFNSMKAKLDELNTEKAEFGSIMENCGDDEVEYLSKQAQKLQKQINSLEGELNSLTNEIKELISQYNKFVKTTEQAVNQRKEYKEKYTELLQSVDRKKKEIEEQLEKIRKGIPEEVMNKYLEKRKDNKYPIVVKVEGDFCTACGTELSISARERLKQEKIIECENCRKLIFVE